MTHLKSAKYIPCAKLTKKHSNVVNPNFDLRFFVLLDPQLIKLFLIGPSLLMDSFYLLGPRLLEILLSVDC